MESIIKKISFSACLIFIGLTCFGQLPKLGLGTKGDDREIMAKSKAGEPLEKLRTHQYYTNKSKDDYQAKVNAYLYDNVDGYLEKLGKEFLNWEENVKRDEEYIESAKALDPKFKWEKLEKDYRNIAAENRKALESEREMHQIRMAYVERLHSNKRTIKHMLHWVTNPSFDQLTNGIYKTLTVFNYKGFSDTVAFLKQKDPEMKNIFGLKEANESLTKTMDDFLIKDLPVAINKVTAEAMDKNKMSYFGPGDTLLSALEKWLPGDSRIKKAEILLDSGKAVVKAQILKREEEQKAYMAQYLEETYLPKAKDQDATMIANITSCAKSELPKNVTLMKVIITEGIYYEKHYFTNEITSKWCQATLVMKYPSGKCYFNDMNYYQTRTNGVYDKMECSPLGDNYIGAPEKPNGTEIKCDRVK